MLDLNMARVDGWTVLWHLSANEHLQTIPLIVLTTSDDPQDQIRALSLGARQYLVKPSDFYRLVLMVESICMDLVIARAQIAQCSLDSQLIEDDATNSTLVPPDFGRNDKNLLVRVASERDSEFV